MDDADLLHAYTTERSEEAFRELVRRHIAIVRGVARRQAGIDDHLADDVTQRVFLALARKADWLRDQGTLVGWLYTAARLEAVHAARTEARRRHWEEKAGNMNITEPEEAAAQISWEKLGPVLDDAMSRLGEADRKAVLLRFFTGRSFAEVGGVFRISEEAARKRVERAVEKLRQNLSRRGIASSAAALGATLSANAAPAVTDEALVTLAASACQQAPAGLAAQLGIYMSTTKATVAVAGAAFLLVGAAIVRDSWALREAKITHAEAAGELADTTRQHEIARRDLAETRHQVAQADAREREIIATTQNPVRPYLQDPAYRALARTARQANNHLSFQRFYRARNLSSDQIAQFEAIMARQYEATLDGQIARDLGRDEQAIFRHSGPEWSTAMVNLLGQDGKRHLEEYLRSTAVRAFIDNIAAQSYETGNPITLEQSDRLAELALAHDPTYQSGKGTAPGNVSWNEIWEPAAKFLTPAQIVTFETAVEVWTLQKRVSLARKGN